MNSSSGGYRSLLAELDGDSKYPEAWKPEPGDAIEGQLVRYTKANTRYGVKDIATVRVDRFTRDGATTNTAPTSVAVWLTPTSIVREFSEKRPQPGERIALKRLQDHVMGDRGRERTIKVFRLAVDRAEPQYVPDWERVGADGN